MALTETRVNKLQVQIWEKLQLAIGEPEKEGVYSCRVTDGTDGKIIISRPEFQYGDTLLANNRTVSVRFTRADAAYSFKAKLIESESKSPDTMYLVDLGKVERLQRRRFVRLDLVYPVVYKILTKPIEEKIQLVGEGVHKARTLNVSAGGSLIQSAFEIKVNNLLLIDYTKCTLKNLPKYVIAICRQNRKDEKQNCLAGLEFILKDDLSRHFDKDLKEHISLVAMKFDDRLQNGLVTELFTEQLILRKKGLL